MKRYVRLIPAFAAMAIATTAGWAHEGHDEDERAIPKTCTQLADTKNFTNDIAFPEVRALKTRCDAEKKASDEKKEAEAKAAAKPEGWSGSRSDRGVKTGAGR